LKHSITTCPWLAAAFLGLAALCATEAHAQAVAGASTGAPPAHILFWKDITGCTDFARGRVASAKALKGSDVAVTVRLLKSGKAFTSTVNNAKTSDFPVGSEFCAQDFNND
jgi:hypothetical protein